ncbi:MAG: uroporphyrinogen-III synthase [Allosphingosinicella sp.]|uniref:uroporphyrinogen-III synthase n=1 Tax=Allosphingosinicella sp. TaxID=2823234 RepID=UPI00395F8178
MKVLILRPEPGASASAARAEALGLAPIKVPLFTVRPLDWGAPQGVDALLLTSANAVRHGGPGLAALRGLPCFAVGEATAAAAREAGFRDVRSGPSDGAALLPIVAAAGHRRILHLCGRDHIPLAHDGLTIERRIAYAADAVEALPAPALAALGEGVLVLVHSPRAGALLARLAPFKARNSLAAISAAAADAAGPGWRAVHVAAAPRDDALLELAAKLCNSGAAGRTGQDG